MTARVIVTAALPDALLAEWLQWVRDFDARHGLSLKFGIVVDAPHLSMAAIEAILAGIEPPFDDLTRIALDPPQRH